VHAFNSAFLHRSSHSAALPLHISHKKVPFVNRAGQLVEPTEPNAIRFERFILDLLPLAKNPLVVEVSPAAAFAPVKNDDSAPTDSPRTARNAMIAQARELLLAAGAQVAPHVQVEVNPLWAFDAAQARSKLPPNTHIQSDRYLS
jgi:UDP-N-acetylglucosamine/UDP-N-acetylgalactosamine diphosphorylase